MAPRSARLYAYNGDSCSALSGVNRTSFRTSPCHAPVCVCVCACACVRACVCLCLCVCVWVGGWVGGWVCVRACACVRAYACVSACACVRLHTVGPASGRMSERMGDRDHMLDQALKAVVPDIAVLLVRRRELIRLPHHHLHSSRTCVHCRSCIRARICPRVLSLRARVRL